MERELVRPTHDRLLWRLFDYAKVLRLLASDAVASRFLKGPDLFAFDALVRKATEEVTRTTVRHYSTNRVTLTPEARECAREIFHLYCALAEINSEHHPNLSIFTTNYDLLLEDMAAEFSSEAVAPLITGFNTLGEGERWMWMDREREDESGIFLRRLHGCVCWFYSDRGETTISFRRENCWNEQRPENLCVNYPGREVWPGQNPHVKCYRNLQKMCETCDCLVFIGFSFHDDDVMQILLNANARRVTPLRIITIDPGMRPSDLRAALADAAMRTPLPIAVPELHNVRSLAVPYGGSGFDARDVLTAVREAIPAPRE
jgi:hypothetical protein